MTNKLGDFIWYELATPDPSAAQAFYGAVIGWTFQPSPGSAEGYTIASSTHGPVGGVTSNAGRGETRARWLGYVAVPDVDAKAAEAVAAGGAQRVPPTDIPGVGRFALLADPQGAAFYIMKGDSEGTSEAFDQAKTGHGNWNELTTSDQAGAFGFYGGLFGWRKGDGMPMDEMGEYQFILHGEQMIGACMRRMENGPPVGWTFYFGVADIDAAAKAVTDGGGALHHGPSEVPGGAMIIVASDPQGGMFGAVGPKKA